MAEEKKEDYRESYTRLFNPILEAICTGNFNGRELKIIFFVIRCTYGWNRKSYPMSRAFIAEGTGISERHVWEVMKGLIKRNVIINYGIDKKTRANLYGLNKKFSQWDKAICPQNGDPQNGADEDVKIGALSAPKTVKKNTGNGADICPEYGAQKRNIKRNIKEKEKKCSQKEIFFNPETELWEQVDGTDEGE